jgi:signal transduction histidine kinase
MHFRNDQLHLVLGLKEQDLWKPLKQLDTSLFIAAALTLVIMSVLSLWIVKLVLEPIRKLGQVMEDVKAHDEKLPDFSDKLEVEFGPIRDAFLHMLNRLQQQYQNTQRFNADISHELKTPLSVLKMSLERALQRDSAEQTQNIVHCLEECENMQSILSKLFLLSQADRGGLSCHFEKLNFKTWLQPFLEDAELLSEELELEILTEIEEADYQLSIDSTLMRTCLYNLIQNAIRYNVLHGFMRFKLSRVENCVHLEISNSGHEIKAEDREQLFERFRRGTSEHQGLGLGLALCKEIVVAHGGRICLKHSNEKESSFLVALPCEREK